MFPVFLTGFVTRIPDFSGFFSDFKKFLHFLIFSIIYSKYVCFTSFPDFRIQNFLVSHIYDLSSNKWNGPIFLQTILITVQAQRVLILYFCFFFEDNKAHNVHDKDVQNQNSITKPHTRSIDHCLLAVQKVSFQMILKMKVKNEPISGSNVLSLNRNRERLQKYWANNARALIQTVFDAWITKLDFSNLGLSLFATLQ